MALRPTLKIIACVIAVLALLGTSIVLAAGSSSPKKLSVACAKSPRGKLQFVAKASDCPASRGKLVRFPQDAPVHTCLLLKAEPGSVRKAVVPPAHEHNVPGMVFRAPGASSCKPPKNANTKPLDLPGKLDIRFCAGKREGTLRKVSTFAACNSLEFDAVLKGLSEPKPNGAPHATDQSVSVNKNVAKPVTLAGTDPDGDSLSFSIVSNPSHGTLTGSGKTRVYHPASGYTGADSFKFRVSDGHGHSDDGTVSITVVGGQAQQPPVVTTSSGSTAYTENGAGTAVDPGLTVTDSDSANLTGAKATIATNLESTDTLSVASQNGISGSYNSGTGVLTLTGTASVAQYQAALRSVEFSSSSDNPATSKTVAFTANDGSASSNSASKTLAITRVNDAPIANGDTGLTDKNTPATLSVLANDTDPDGGPLHVASVDTTGTKGTVTINPDGTIGYDPNGQFSTLGPHASAHDTFTYRANDGTADSSSATVDVTVTGVNQAPVLSNIESSALALDTGPTAAAPVTGTLQVADADNATLKSAKVTITGGFNSPTDATPGADTLAFVDELGITHSYDSSTGVLTLTSASGTSVADWQQALRDVKYSASSPTPSGGRTISFQIDDGEASNHASNLATRDITLTHKNHAPVAANDTATTTEKAATTIGVLPNDSDEDGDSPLHVSSVDTTGTLGTVTINPDGTIGYDPNGQFNNLKPGETATDSFKYKAADPSNADSNQATVTVTISGVNDAPSLTAGGTLSYGENDPAAQIDNTVTPADVDNANLSSAKVKISSGFQSGTDLLTFTAAGGISGSQTGDTLNLTGSASIADWQSVLRSVKFRSTSDNPGTTRTIEWTVNDGGTNSNTPTSTINVTAVNDAPTVTTNANALAFTEGDGATPIDPTLTASDPDSTQMSGATVKITSNFTSGQDVLSFDNSATPGITGTLNGAGDTMTLSGTDTLANYVTAMHNVKYDNTSNAPSPATRTVTFKLTDSAAAESSPATRDITVADVNSSPTLTAGGTLSYGENDPAAQIDNTVTPADVDNANLSSAKVKISSGFQSGTDLLTFTAAGGISGSQTGDTLNLTGSASIADWQSVLRSVKFRSTSDNPGTTRTIEWTVNDGGTNSNTPTSTISITAVNDAPTVATNTNALAFHEGDGATAIDSTLTASDPDSTQMSGATVKITNNFTSGEDVLAFDNTATPGITGTLNGAGDTMTLSGTDTLANYITAMRAVTYNNTSSNPSNATRTVTFQLTDSSGAPSNTPTRDITIAPVNNAPTLTAGGTLNYTEGDAATQIDNTVTPADVDDTNLESAKVKISSGFQSGTDLLTFTAAGGITGSQTGDTLNLTGSASIADWQSVLRSVKFQSTSAAPGTSRTIQWTVSDGTDNSNTPTSTINITQVNSAPAIGLAGTSLTYTEGDGPKLVDGAATLTDAEGDTISSATVSLTGGTFNSAQDTLAASPPVGITANYATGTGVLTLSGTAPASDYQAALQSVTYANSSNAPSPATRTISVAATDTGSPPATTSPAATRGISIVAVNDPPTAVADTGTTNEDTILSTPAPGVLSNDTDPDGVPPDTQTVTKLNGSTTLTGTSTAGAAVTINANGSYSYDPTGVAAFQAMGAGQSTGDVGQPPDDTFTYTMKDSAGVESTATVTIHVTGVNDTPVANGDTFNGIGNTALYVGTTKSASDAGKVISGSVLTNDTDADTGTSLVTQSVVDQGTLGGGKVTIDGSGHFTYQPPAGVTGSSDSFTYTVCDTTPCDGTTPAGDKATGTTTVPLAGQVWYVKNDSTGANNGTSHDPFTTIAQADSASSTGDTTFVFKGNGNAYTGGYTMAASERLLGEVNGLTLDPDGGGAQPTFTLHDGTANAYPLVTSTTGDVVTLGNAAELRGFNIDPGSASGGGVFGAAAGGTLDKLNIVDTGTSGGQAGLELNGSSGTFDITDLTVSTTGAGVSGVRLNNAGLTNFKGATSTISVTSDGGKALEATSTNMGAGSQFDLLKTTASTAGGVGMINTTGTTQLGDGSGADLDLTTSSSSSAGLSLINPGTVTIPSAGTADIHADGGPAVSVQNSASATLPLDTVQSSNSTTNGINWDSNGAVTFSPTSGGTGISKAAGTAVRVNGGAGDFTYPGNVGSTVLANDGTGATASISGRTAGTVTLSGVLADSSDPGGGITVSGNTGGTTAFTGSSQTFNTGASDAVSLSGNGGHTINFSGGSLSATATSGKGVDITAGGTVNITGNSNTIATTNGGALNVDSTTIGASGIKFHSIAANGAPNGIKLNGTGTSGSLSVTGDATSAAQGGDSSAGTIQSTTGDAISLTNTLSPSFEDLNVQSPAHSGVRGVGVNNFTLKNSTIQNAGESAASASAPLDGAVSFNNDPGGANDNIHGTLTVTNNKLLRGYEHGLKVIENNATISNAIVQNNLITQQEATDIGGDGIGFHMNGTTTTAASLTKGSITGNTLTNLRGSGIVVGGGNSSTSTAPVVSLGTPSGSTPGTGTNIIDVSSNSIVGGAQAGADVTNMMQGSPILVGGDGRAQDNFKVTNNGTALTPIQGFRSIGIGTGGAGDGTHNVQIDNNFVSPGSSNDLNSAGIGITSDKNSQSDSTVLRTPTVNASVTNNTVSSTNGFGIRSLASDSDGTHRVRLQGNTVGAPSNAAFASISDEAGTATDVGHHVTVCTDVQTNTASAGQPNGNNTASGIVLRERRAAGDSSSAVLQIQNVPNGSTPTAAEVILSAQNPNSQAGGTGFHSSKVTVFTSASDPVDGCTLPF